MSNNICLSNYTQYLTNKGYKIYGSNKCSYGEKCKYTHDIKNIQMKSNYRKWLNKDKSHIDIDNVRYQIINILKNEKSKVNKDVYINKIDHINSLNLKQLLLFWTELYDYYNSIYKQVPHNRKHYIRNIVDGYRFKENVPDLRIKNDTDVRFLCRTLQMCPSQEKLLNTKKLHKKSLCLNMDNCEFVHQYEHLCCYDDLLNGDCKNDNCSYLHYTEQGLKPLNINESVITNDDYLMKPVIRIKKKNFN